jgi:predicted MFS family arabinose efflux permease
MPCATAQQRSPARECFANANYRNQWFSDALSQWGYEMETLILGWYILVETNSPFLVGVVGALRYGGTLLSPLLGVYADRLPMVPLLFAIRLVFAIVAAGVAAAAWFEVLVPAHAFIAAATAGLLRAPEMVMRHTLLGAIVPSRLLVNAIGYSRVTMDTSKIVGAFAGAGAMATLGIDYAYLIVTSMYGASIGFTLCMRLPTNPRAGAPSSAVADLLAGLRYIRHSPTLLLVMAMAFFANLTAFPLTNGFLPIVARDVFGLDELGLAQLVSTTALGALVGSLVIGSLRRLRAAQVMVVGLVVWHALVIVFAAIDQLALAFVTLFLIGAASSAGMIAMAVTLLQVAEAQFRGRANGLRQMAVYGVPMGLLAGGQLIEQFGVDVCFYVFGCVGMCGVAITAWAWHRAEPASGETGG